MSADPKSTENLCVFARYVANYVTSDGTVRNYVSDVRSVGKLLGYKVEEMDQTRCKVSIKGIAKELNHVKVQKEGVTVEMLVEMSKYVNWEKSEDVTFCAMLLTLFFLLLRKSNITVKLEKKGLDKNA